MEVVGFALVSAVCAFFLGELGYRGARLVSVISAVMILVFVLNKISTPITELEDMLGGVSLSDIGVTIVKIIGVGYVTGISADVCNDMGAPRIADGLSLLGRVEIFTVVLPYFKEIITVGGELLK